MDKIEWLKARKIGGSDAAAIIGVHPYKTAYEVWERLVGETTGEIEMNWQMKMGVLLEPVAADLYVEETGREVRKRPQRAHPDYDFITGNIDREILVGNGVDSPGILEIKCPTIRTMVKVKREGLRDDMTVQLQHYFGIWEYDWGSSALFNQDAGYINFDLEADQEFISMLIEKEVEFWNKYVVPRIPPPTDTDSKSIAIPQIEGEMTFIDSEEWWDAARELQEATFLKKTAVELEKVAKETVKDLMHREEIHAAEVDGFARFYYKQYPGRTSWKKTAENLAKEAGLDVETFKSIGKSHTKFNSYFIGKGE